MSIETVKQRCIENNPDGDDSRLDASIEQQAQRFERVVKTAFNEERLNFCFAENKTEAKNAYFEKYKLEYVHQHLAFLIDLYDYKAKD